MVKEDTLRVMSPNTKMDFAELPSQGLKLDWVTANCYPLLGSIASLFEMKLRSNTVFIVLSPELGLADRFCSAGEAA